MKILILITIFLTGCTDITSPELKCQDGILYVKNNGAWVQAMLYKDNKCLPMTGK